MIPRTFSDDLFYFESCEVAAPRPHSQDVRVHYTTGPIRRSPLASHSRSPAPAVSAKDAQTRRWVQSQAFSTSAASSHRTSPSTSSTSSLEISVFDTDSEDEGEYEDDASSVSFTQSEASEEDSEYERSAIYMTRSSSHSLFSRSKRLLPTATRHLSSSPSSSLGLRPFTPARKAAPAIVVDLRVRGSVSPSQPSMPAPVTAAPTPSSYPPQVILLEEASDAEVYASLKSSLERLPSLTSASSSSSSAESDMSRSIPIHPTRPLTSPQFLWEREESPIRSKVIEQQRGRSVRREGRLWV